MQALPGQVLHHQASVVLRGSEPLRVEVPEELDGGRIPRPPEVHGKFPELILELLLRRHGRREFNGTALGGKTGIIRGPKWSTSHAYSPSSWPGEKARAFTH